MTIVYDPLLGKIRQAEAGGTSSETTETIKTKLGTASSSTDGYLTSTNWNIFNGKQASLGFTPENTANKAVSISGTSTDTQYPTAKLLYDQLALKQNTLVSGTSIKTINGTSVLGSGDLTVSGFSWGATATGTSGTCLALTVDNNASASTLGQSITIGNTQTNAAVGLNVAIGSANIGNVGIKANSYGGGNVNSTSIHIDSDGSTRNAPYKSQMFINSAPPGRVSYTAYYSNDALQDSSSIDTYIAGNKVGFLAGGAIQKGFVFFGKQGISSPIAFQAYIDNGQANSSGNIQYTYHNTQSGAGIMQKIDLGTSAQGHTGLLINAHNASTSARGININPSTTGTGYGVYISDRGGNAFCGWRHDFINPQSGETRYGIYQGTIGQSSGSTGVGYGIYQSIIGASNTGTSYGLYIANLVSSSATTEPTKSQYFSLNNAQSTNLSARTVDTAEYLFSRTNTATTGTVADSFNNLYFKDTAIQNGAGGTFTVAGAVLKLETVATQTAGTLTHDKTVLSLVASNNSTGGHIRFNSYSGAPTTDGTLWFDGSNLKIRVSGTTYTLTKA